MLFMGQATTFNKQLKHTEGRITLSLSFLFESDHILELPQQCYRITHAEACLWRTRNLKTYLLSCPIPRVYFPPLPCSKLKGHLLRVLSTHVLKISHSSPTLFVLEPSNGEPHFSLDTASPILLEQFKQAWEHRVISKSLPTRR